MPAVPALDCLAAVAALGVLSLLGFALAVHDKRQARRAAHRVRERSLLLLALAGAWPGLAIAFVLVRHKTRKTRSLTAFVLLAALSTAGWLAALDLLGCVDLPGLADS